MNGRRVHLRVQGRVQGVSFRDSAKAEARGLQLLGWVRNLPSGDVEAVAQGDGPQVAAFIDWCRRGPVGAHVTHLAVEDAPQVGELHGFEVRP
jgi:acylphosphatase